MTSLLRQRRHVGRLGGLNDGAALPALDPGELAHARNIEHDRDGSISKRPGRKVHAALAAASEPLCAPVAAGTTDSTGTLPEGWYWVRVTYGTAAGETDDLHSSDASNPAPAEAAVNLTGGQNAITVAVPFHLRKVQVATHEILTGPADGSTPCETGTQGHQHLAATGCGGGTVACQTLPTLDTALDPGESVTFFTVTPAPVSVCSEAVFDGWLVYSRSPRIQDETHLGVNCDADTPLYHRTEPLGTIRQYDSATSTFVMNGGVSFGLDDCLDENSVDIMMPDRGGLPIRHFNVYLSRDGINYFYATSGTDGSTTVLLTDYDETNTRAPSTRIDRTAPTVSATTTLDTPVGACGPEEVLSGIEAGLYKVRYTWVTADPDIVEDPGLATVAALLDIPPEVPPKRCRQETWPSCAAYVSVDKGESIVVTPPSFPDGVIGWSVYTERVEPFDTLTMEGGVYSGDGDIGPTDDNERPFAWYFPDQDRDPFLDATVLARKADLATFPPLGSANGTTDESGPANSAAYEEFATTTNIDCFSENVFDTNTRGFRPGYEDVQDFVDASGSHPLLFASSRDESDANRMDFDFWMPQSASYADATHAVVRLRIRIRGGRPAAFNPAEDYLSYFRAWDAADGEWDQLDTGFVCDNRFHEYAYTITDLATRKTAWTVGGNAEDFLSFSFYATNNVGFDIDHIEVDLVQQPSTVCTYGKLLPPDRGAYENQTSGGSPHDFGAWYSGHTLDDDATINTKVTLAALDDIPPKNARNYAPNAYEEYGNTSRMTGIIHQVFPSPGNYQSIGSFSAPGGTIALPSTPANFPCIHYGDFTLRRVSDGFVYTNYTDYDFDVYTGAVTDLAIGTGVELEVQYNLPILVSGTEPREPFTAQRWQYNTGVARVPSYEDICAKMEIVNCYDEYATLFASTRDDVQNNRQHWWFRCEDADVAGFTAAKLVVEITYRLRDGGGSWKKENDASRKIRMWDQGAFDVSGVPSTSWVDLETGLAGTGVFGVDGEFETRRWGIPFDGDMRLTYTDGVDGPATALSSPRKYFVVDMAAWDYNGFDVADVRIEIWPAITDPVITNHELCQRQRITDTTYTLQNPLVERPVVDSQFITETAQGGWLELWPNTTAQWPVVTHSVPIVGDDGVDKALAFNFLGCADSVFRDKDNGTIERVYHVEGKYWPAVMKQDWRFANYLWRVFFCNPGFPNWNLRFDGKQTFPMGLPWPAVDWDEVTDEAGNYLPPSATDVDPTGLDEDDECLASGERPLGRIVENTSISVDLDEPIPEGVVCWDVEYYIVYKRVVRTPRRSYVVRSRPRKLTETVQVCANDDTPALLRLEFEVCPEPQVTHVELYRNQASTAQYFLVDEIALDESVSRMCDATDPDYSAGPDGRLMISFDDEIPATDDDLTLPAEFETGRPPAATMMLFHRGRIWFVQQDDRELIAFTNVTSPSGAVNPEGFDANHVIDPPMRSASAITCLSVYHTAVLAHSENGIVGVSGLSDDQNSAQGLAASAFAADAGAVGPDAWANVDNIQYIMTPKGPGVVMGDEIAYLGQKIEGSLETANLRAPQLYASRVIHYRTRGKSQVWFTHTQDQFGEMNRCWVFDEEVTQVEDRTMFWKVFTEMPVHGLTVTEDGAGIEFPLMGGCDGRAYRHGRGATDAGLFIEFDVRTAFIDEGEYGRSIQPRWAYWDARGDVGDCFFVDVRKDFEQRNVNQSPIRIQLGGGTGVYWNAGWWSPDAAEKWQDTDVRPYVEQRMSMGTFFRQLQFRLSQEWSSLPPGDKRAATFECSGYTLFFRLMGPRPATSVR
jgi:hypothetical protein